MTIEYTRRLALDDLRQGLSDAKAEHQLVSKQLAEAIGRVEQRKTQARMNELAELIVEFGHASVMFGNARASLEIGTKIYLRNLSLESVQ